MKIGNNVTLSRIRPCTGCGACISVCPENAISYQISKGFYVPVVDSKKCINCGRCKKVCYSHSSYFDDVHTNSQITAYYGGVKNKNDLKKSSSGGAFFALANYLIENGYYIVGCVYNTITMQSQHIVTNDLKLVSKMRGSKYFQSNTFELMKDIKSYDLQTKFAVFGTPCQIFGIKKALNLLGFKGEQLYIELFCHGVTSPIVWQKYLFSKKYNHLIENIEFRTKDYGWHIPSNAFVLKNGKRIITNRLGDPFFDIYYSTNFFNLSCYSCNCKKDFCNADIRIGDYWGDKFKHNTDGVSCVLSLSKKGDEIVKNINHLFMLENEELNQILAGQSYNSDPQFNTSIYNSVTKMLYNNKASIRTINRCANQNRSLLNKICRTIYIPLSNFKNRLWKKR